MAGNFETDYNNILQNTPIAVIDSTDVIVWSTQNSGEHPLLPVGSSIRDLVPELDDLLSESCPSYALVNISGKAVSTNSSNQDDDTTILLMKFDYPQIQKDSTSLENIMFQMILDSPYEGMIYVDENKIIRYVNEAFAKYNNTTRDKIIGHRLEDRVSDGKLERIFQTKAIEPFTYTTIGTRKFIASRRPVFDKGTFRGAFSQYLSIDARDVENKYGKAYIDLIAGLQTKDIMSTVAQTMIELNSYKDEFNKANKARRGIDNIIGDSPIMNELKKKVLVLSDSPSSVLITGESGTGKELFAQAIHFHGDRSSQPFVKVNCAAIPESLLESELFGYTEGAFTGARKGGKMGKFELANQGTVFLDEIGDMPLSMQAKLLRVLQEREIEHLGGEKTIPIDVRIVSATNRNLLTLVEEGRFREDLYYRINVVNLDIPPLRERKEDIVELVNYTINILNKNLKQSVQGVSPEALRVFLNHDWPGNVRELINVLESAMNFCRSSILDIDALPYSLYTQNSRQSLPESDQALQAKVDDVEKEQLLSVLKQCNNKRRDAAAKLNVSKSTLYRLMKKHDLL